MLLDWLYLCECVIHNVSKHFNNTSVYPPIILMPELQHKPLLIKSKIIKDFPKNWVGVAGLPDKIINFYCQDSKQFFSD